MKKIALHTHLDGSLDQALAAEIAGYDVSQEMIGHGSDSLADYLSKFAAPIGLLQSWQSLRDAAYRLALALAADSVIYAEVRFCPLYHTRQGLYPYQVIQAVLEGLRAVPELKSNLILCMMRDFPRAKNEQIISLAQEALDRGVCGIDLAGDEAAHPNCEFEELFALAKQRGIPFTIHAGEADSYQGINDAICFGAQRIGHGVRSAESNYTMKKLIAKQIPLEICVTSNFDTHLYRSPEEHPVKRLLDIGIPVVIDADNRTVSNITLEQEYEMLMQRYGFTEEDLLRCNLTAALSAFLDPAEKVALCQELLQDFAKNHS